MKYTEAMKCKCATQDAVQRSKKKDQLLELEVKKINNVVICRLTSITPKLVAVRLSSCKPAAFKGKMY
jgi:hypothetical protein